MFILSHTVDDETVSDSYSGSLTFRFIIVAHELDEIGLEDLLCGCLLAFLELIVQAGAEWIALLGLSLCVFEADAEAVEHEHPLVHLELLDVQLGHKLDDLDRLPRQRIVANFSRGLRGALAFRGSEQVDGASERGTRLQRLLVIED